MSNKPVHFSKDNWPVCTSGNTAQFIARHGRQSEIKSDITCKRCLKLLGIDAAEIAYWNFDARRKGLGEWKGQPQSERDAFKAEFNNAVG